MPDPATKGQSRLGPNVASAFLARASALYDVMDYSNSGFIPPGSGVYSICQRRKLRLLFNLFFLSRFGETLNISRC